MRLTARQQKILGEIVEIYIRTGEPVGSKLLSQRMDIQVSPATIRSEMAFLFEMGYLEQPHTSAGRVPSHLGFREYIDSLMTCQPLTKEERDEIDSLFNIKNPDPDKLLEDAANALSDYTGYASITSSIVPNTVRVKRIELIAAGNNTVVILLIASNGLIKNKIARVDFDITPELLSFFNKFANSRFSGRSMENITSAYISSISLTLGEYSRIFTSILISIFELCCEVSAGQYYIGGSVKLLEYEELNRLSRELLIMLDNRDQLKKLFNLEGNENLTILIGKENTTSELSRSAVVATHYDISGEPAGTIGLIGPVRLDYSKIIPHMQYFAKTLGELLSDTLENDE